VQRRENGGLPVRGSNGAELTCALPRGLLEKGASVAGGSVLEAVAETELKPSQVAMHVQSIRAARLQGEYMPTYLKN